ncbi:kinesin-related protein 4 isoform X1 [Cucumis melo var. makuwa]|uniref:Kinesin-related protein 4 isoform X1 n=1 Tax=Cucumis melo var. makuwa TaxID=1194695 RepID=A0A5D3C380_CUCMM|nr:kinesin-related protein 4 isoform X1 [Cucumis melo var. makuwa]TYK06267.1 kinesin-related protein 4 isoform X1 [Cucumis melo var. makuwa]
MASSTSLSRSKRPSTISPFRSRKSPGLSSASRPNGRPTTTSSTTSSRPPSKVSVSPMTTASCNPSPSILSLDRFDVMKAKENVTVAVRFRPLRFQGVDDNNRETLSLELSKSVRLGGGTMFLSCISWRASDLGIESFDEGISSNHFNEEDEMFCMLNDLQALIDHEEETEEGRENEMYHKKAPPQAMT